MEITKTVERVFEVLKNEGLTPRMEEYGIGFKFQMTNFIYMQDEADENFFNLIIPYIFDVNEENEHEVLCAINTVNSLMKVVKLVISNKTVWVCFEHKGEKNLQLESLVPLAIGSLYQARQRFYEELEKESIETK